MIDLVEPSAPAAFKAAAYGHVARLAKALSSGPRVAIVDLLAQRPRHVEGIAHELGLSIANTSRHLGVLRAVGLVASQRHGARQVYRPADASVALFVAQLRALAHERLADLERDTEAFFAARGDRPEAVDPVDVLKRATRGEVTLIDVRPSAEYEAGHVRGSVSVPSDAVGQHLAKLPHDRPVVAYCRGPYCVMAHDAVAQLRAAGFDAHVVPYGVVDWSSRTDAQIEVRA